MASDYSQGVCQDGAAILKDGQPMTIEEILAELRAAPQPDTVEQVRTEERARYKRKLEQIDAGVEEFKAMYARGNAQPQPAVPGHLMARIKNLLIALGHQGAVLDDGEPPYDVGERGIKEAQELYTLLSTTTPQADGWVRCEDRLPTEADADCEGLVWSTDKSGDGIQMDPILVNWSYVTKGPGHWMPTGLKRPQPPKQEGE